MPRNPRRGPAGRCHRSKIVRGARWVARAFAWACCLAVIHPDALAQRFLEVLGRGVIALKVDERTVYVGWRLCAQDAAEIAFNVYRASDGGTPLRLNPEPLIRTTDFVDVSTPPAETHTYTVRAIANGREEHGAGTFALPGRADPRPYFSIPLKTPTNYQPNDASVGDLDGDGEFEIVLHQAARGRDNSQAGQTAPPLLQAYRLDGTFLWEINLGRNIREGAHYTQFIVFDLDGDGRAEVACKTADGTTDGVGTVLGDPRADYVSKGGRTQGKILDGPEYLTIFEGRTGRALATTDYIPARGARGDWGDDYGNRVDRFLACVAFLDGARPSLVMCRGYYTRAVLVAWNWRRGQLTRLWTFDSDDGTPGNEAYRGQGNHNLSVADVDADGRDEIIYGAGAIDDNGEGLYSTGLGHGDAMHLSDLDPDHPGLEVFGIHERPNHPNGANLREARTGKVLWGKASRDVGRGLALDLDPRHRGAEMWAAGFGELWNAKGGVISHARPRSCNMGIWWDGDLLREILDGVTITKWDFANSRELPLLSGAEFNAVPNNGTKANPSLCADLIGDWREELVCRTRDNQTLLIFSTTIPARQRLVTWMHDPVYRLGIAWQNVAYNQPAHASFSLLERLEPPPLKPATNGASASIRP